MNTKMDPKGAAYEYFPIHLVSDRDLVALCEAYFDSEALGYDEFDDLTERRGRYFNAIDNYIATKIRTMDVCKRIVSFGCGTGRREAQIVQVLAPAPAPEVIGIEISARMGSIATSRGLRVIRNLGDAGTPPPGSVDLAICLYSFIHLPDRETRLGVLRSLARALREGGLLILDVFNLCDKYEWRSKISDGGSGVRPPLSGEHRGDVIYRRRAHQETSYMHYFTVGEICSLVEDAGLTITELSAVGHGHLPGKMSVPLDEGCLLLTCYR